MVVSLVVALSENRVIGKNGGLPWHLPLDLRRFKRLTMGHILLMGRKTFASIGRPLPGRRSIVLTRNPAYRPEGVLTAGSLEDALRLSSPDEEVFVIGGASVFAEAHPLADRLHLTRVHAEIEGDTFFPEEALSGWVTVAEERHPADERHAHAFTFFTCVRGGTEPAREPGRP